MKIEIKKIEEIKNLVSGEKIFIFSCDNCGFESIEKKNKEIFSYLSELEIDIVRVYDLTKDKCNVGSLKRIIDEIGIDISRADNILTFTCGGLPQILPNYIKKPVIPATNTLKIEPGRSLGSFARLCSACGECWIYYTGNLCMEKLCPKKMRNGPCGGAEDGICEVYERLCPWVILFRTNRISEEDFLKIVPPKDFSKILLQE